MGNPARHVPAGMGTRQGSMGTLLSQGWTQESPVYLAWTAA